MTHTVQLLLFHVKEISETIFGLAESTAEQSTDKASAHGSPVDLSAYAWSDFHILGVPACRSIILPS
jgi:hypothetical protein